MDNDALGIAMEARARMDGLLAILAAADGTIDIDAFALQQLLQPTRDSLARLEQALKRRAVPLRAAQ